MSCDKCNKTFRELFELYKIGEFEGYEVPRPDTKNKAELRCKWCGRFTGWLPKDENENKRRPTPSKEIDYCQLCRRNKDDLGDHETIEIHHVDGNPNNQVDANLWHLCTKHHALVHHEIIYFQKMTDKLNRIRNQD